MTGFLLDQFEILADAPGGVQRLRELILQLAVTGRLGTGDERDEPAKVLFNRILSSSSHKKPLSDKRIDLDINDPIDIPCNWIWTTLESISQINPRNDGIDDETEVSFLPMEVIPQGFKGDYERRYRLWRDVKAGFTHIADNDVIVAKITPCFQNRKSIVVKGLLSGFGAGTTELHVIRTNPNQINPYYVLLFLKSPNFIQDGIINMTGSAGQKRVPKNYLTKSSFPLPPVAEQHRIVEKVDSLMALCDDLEAKQTQKYSHLVKLGTGSLNALQQSTTEEELHRWWGHLQTNFGLIFDCPENVEALRQTVLQLAVTGRLGTGDDGDEDASKLLERIFLKRTELKKNKKTVNNDIANGEVESLYDIPDSWEWAFLGSLSEIIEYGSSVKSHSDSNGIPILRMNNLVNGKINFSQLKYVDNDIEGLPKLYLRKGDLLFNRTNSYELVGKTSIFDRESFSFTFASYLIRIRLFDEVAPEYVNLAMNSWYYRKTQIEPKIVQQCGQANFNGTKLRETLIPLPPFDEQRRIVEKVDNFMSLCDLLEKKIECRSQSNILLTNPVIQRIIGIS